MVYALVLALAGGGSLPISDHYPLPACLEAGEQSIAAFSVGPLGPLVVGFACLEKGEQ